MINIKQIIAIFALLTIQTSFATTGVINSGSVNADNTTVITNTSESSFVPRLVNKTATGVTLEWDKVSAAAAYIIKYSKTSVATSKDPNAQYTDETDQIVSTGTTITPLDSDTEYFFSIVTVDKEGNESQTFSNELSIKTDSGVVATATGTTVTTATGSSFALSKVEPINTKEISIEFSSPLGTQPIEVKITKDSDHSDIAIKEVIIDSTNPSRAIVRTDISLDPNTAYQLVVVSAFAQDGDNIKEGTNGTTPFTTPASLAPAPEELNAAGSGSTMSGSSLSGSVNPSDLTKAETGAKENIIIITALIFSFGLVYFYRRKFAN